MESQAHGKSLLPMFLMISMKALDLDKYAPTESDVVTSSKPTQSLTIAQQEKIRLMVAQRLCANL